MMNLLTRTRFPLCLVTVSDASVVPLPAFFATAGCDCQTKAVVLKATHYGQKPVRGTVQLDSAARVGARGKHIVIRADKPADENSLADPRRLVPQETLLPNCGQQFSVTFAPLSVNLLRIPATSK